MTGHPIPVVEEPRRPRRRRPGGLLGADHGRAGLEAPLPAWARPGSGTGATPTATAPANVPGLNGSSGLPLHVRQLLGVAHGVEPGDQAASTRTATTLSSSPLSRMMSAGEPLTCAGSSDSSAPTVATAATTRRATRSAPTTGTRHADAATVAQGDHVRGEEVEQALQVARLDRPLEGSSAPGPRPERRPRAGARDDVRPRPVGDLADRPGSCRRRGAISSYPRSNTSRSTNTARSVGASVSSTSSIAIETLSASSTSSATSGAVSSGSGSQGPTYDSLRRPSVRSRRACRAVIRTR